MAKDYNSYSFKNRSVDNIQSRSNTANDPEDKKKKKKKTKPTYTTNADGSVTKTRTKRSGDIVKKTVKKPTRTSTPSEPKVIATRDKEQRKKETAIQKKADQMVEDKGLITAPTPKEKRKIERTKRQVSREVIRAEKKSQPKYKKPKSKLGSKKGAYKSKGGGGDSSSNQCPPTKIGKGGKCNTYKAATNNRN